MQSLCHKSRPAGPSKLLLTTEALLLRKSRADAQKKNRPPGLNFANLAITGCVAVLVFVVTYSGEVAYVIYIFRFLCFGFLCLGSSGTSKCHPLRMSLAGVRRYRRNACLFSVSPTFALSSI